MWPSIFSFLGQLVKPLGILFGALFMKHQGSKEAKLKGKAEALEEAKDALADKEDLKSKSDDDLNDIVFFNNDSR